MRRWLVLGALVAALAALAATAPRWWPPVGKFLGAESELIQALEAAIQLILLAVAAVASGLGYLGGRRARDRRPLPSPERMAQAKGGGAVSGEVHTRGGSFAGRDSEAIVGGNASGSGASSLTAKKMKVDIHHHHPPAAPPEAPEEQPVAPDLETLRSGYLRELTEEYRYLSLKGLPQVQVAVKIPLLDLYVPLQGYRRLPEGGTWKPEERRRLAGRELTGDEEGQPEGLLERPEPVLGLLTRPDTRALILLGDPGSGKTTFLKMLALKLAGGEGEELGLGRRLPVLVPLSGYADALADGEPRLDDYIARRHHHEEGSDLPFGALLAEALSRGEALILLDGLDEVKDRALRGTVVRRVRSFVLKQAERGNRFIVTSRVVGYAETRPDPAEGLVECTLVDFGDEEIEAFAGRWTAALERAAHGETRKARRQAERERTELLAAIHRNPQVRYLAANPLLLTILAVMKRQDVVLPDRRVKLYDRYVKTLVETWNQARGLGRDYTPALDATVTERHLAAVALWMHRENPSAGLVRYPDLARQLEGLFAKQGEPEPGKAAERFLDDVGRESGLLLERGSGEYGFIHLSFEEYLSAVGLCNEAGGDGAAIARVLGATVGQPAWREVTLLTVGYLGLVVNFPDNAGRVVEGLVRERPGPAGEAVLLAGEAVADVGEAGVPAASRQRVEAALVETMQAGQMPPKARRRAGLVLSRLGWVPEDLDTFIEIPAGEFLYGEDKERRVIADPYWIAKYPVTNLQFRRFVDDGGYRREELWSREGWEWLKEEGREQPGLWADPEWASPLCPVVAVSWYEAEAYCRWLGGRPEHLGGLDGALPPSHVVRLPTEEEWERAARGRDGREYPWGEGFAVERANTDESDTERRHGVRTTAVATHPQGRGPEGLWDAAGNVWEWAVSRLSEEDPTRVVRGGSWIYGSRSARCAYRYGLIPSYFFNDLGFRCGVFPGAFGS